MPLSKETVKNYRAIGHALNPVVMISDKGLSEGVMNELERALYDHELIKVKVAIGDRAIRQQLIQEAVNRCKADIIQEIGKTVLIFRKSEKPNIKNSNVR